MVVGKSWRNRLFAPVVTIQVLAATRSIASVSETLKSQQRSCLASPPNQVTFSQSPTSASAAYVIDQDCTIWMIYATRQSDGSQTMDASGQNIAIVKTLPDVDLL